MAPVGGIEPPSQDLQSSAKANSAKQGKKAVKQGLAPLQRIRENSVVLLFLLSTI